MRSQRVPGRRAGDSKGLTAELAAAGSWDDELTTTGGTKTLATCYIRYTANHKISGSPVHAVGTAVQWVISLFGLVFRMYSQASRSNYRGYLYVLKYLLFVSRAPSVSCAARLKLSICLFFFYPGISSEPLNLSQQKFAR